MSATGELVTVAALYVERDGVYWDQPGVDAWDRERDARLYNGPYPVVAHPPCSAWCQLASVNEKRWGARIGADGGCFKAALFDVRRWGGVLEHPAVSIAWTTFGLPRPSPGGWQRSFFDDAYVTEISQVAYGHDARKRTWLYYVGAEPPALNWSEPYAAATVGASVHSGDYTLKPRSQNVARTPEGFRDVLLSMARRATLCEPIGAANA